MTERVCTLFISPTNGTKLRRRVSCLYLGGGGFNFFLWKSLKETRKISSFVTTTTFKRSTDDVFLIQMTTEEFFSTWKEKNEKSTSEKKLKKKELSSISPLPPSPSLPDWKNANLQKIKRFTIFHSQHKKNRQNMSRNRVMLTSAQTVWRNCSWNVHLFIHFRNVVHRPFAQSVTHRRRNPQQYRSIADKREDFGLECNWISCKESLCLFETTRFDRYSWVVA